MLPAFRPNQIAIVSPALEARDGDEVYVQLASGECLVRLLHTSRNGYILKPYNPAHHARLVGKGEIEAMHVIVYSRRRPVAGLRHAGCRRRRRAAREAVLGRRLAEGLETRRQD